MPCVLILSYKNYRHKIARVDEALNSVQIKHEDYFSIFRISQQHTLFLTDYTYSLNYYWIEVCEFSFFLSCEFSILYCLQNSTAVTRSKFKKNLRKYLLRK